MQLKMVKTKKDYLRSLERFEEIFQAKPGADESDEADALALSIKQYEVKHYIIGAPTPRQS
jgi:HTH-type transcriptional regulator/antitoxin HigA